MGGVTVPQIESDLKQIDACCCFKYFPGLLAQLAFDMLVVLTTLNVAVCLWPLLVLMPLKQEVKF